MQSVEIIERYEKESQTVQIVEDSDGDQYIQIMNEMYVNTPVWEGDVYQAEQLIGILQKAIRDAE